MQNKDLAFKTGEGRYRKQNQPTRRYRVVSVLLISFIFCIVMLAAPVAAAPMNGSDEPDNVVDSGLIAVMTTTDIDLIVSAGPILSSSPSPNLLAHYTANIIKATVKNQGTQSAGSFNVLFNVSGNVTSVPVAGLEAGSSIVVNTTDIVDRSVGASVPVTVTADAEAAVAESNETNNQYSYNAAVIRNGYTGMRWGDGTDITTTKVTTLHGDIIYSLGNSAYGSGSAAWTAGDLQIPAGATVKDARLYITYCWDSGNVMPGSAVTSFNGVSKSYESFYSDKKNWGGYAYPFGVIIYNVTDQFNTSGNSVSATGIPPIRGMELVVTYEDPTATEKQIFVNEGFDLLYASPSYYTTEETATAYAPFTGASITLGNVKQATLTTFINRGGSGITRGTMFFNGEEYPNYWTIAGPEIGVNTTDVTAYLKETGNTVAFRSLVANNMDMEPHLAILKVERKGSSPAPDLIVTSISPNAGAGAFLFANEPNVISIKVKNNGTADAVESTLIVDVSGAVYYANVSALGAGANQTVTVSDTISRTNGTVVRINATAGGGKFLVSDLTVYNNGYKGKRWTGGSDMNTQVSFDGRYGITYSAGDTVYAGASWTTKTFNWSATDLPIPAGATVASARLYQGYTYNQMITSPAFSMAFNSNTVTPVATYLDRKSFGTYDFPYGLYVYDVTSQFNTAGNSITITPEAGNNYALYGGYLVVVYQDAGTTEKKIFVNDEFDMVWSRSTYSTNNEEATVYANFTGIDNNNIAGAKAIAILASASDVNKSKFFFDGTEYTGFWSNYQSGPQIGFSPYDVTTALTSGLNVAKLQSFDMAGNGDSMYAMNVILVVEKTATTTDLIVTSISPNAGVGAFLFANEPNLINVTVRNNGTAAAGESTISVDVAGALYYVNVSALGAGAIQTVTISDTISHTNGTVVRINTTAGGGKFLVSDQTVYNNGYKGKRWTGGSDMNTQVSFDGRYGITYSAGDTVYAGASWTTKTFNWSATDLPIPAGATVASARLYQGYSYNRMTTSPAFTMAFNSNTVTPVATYLDRKSFGAYDYPYGLYVYDVTSRFNTAGNSITITPEAGNNYALYGAYLIVVYQDAGTTIKKIFVNDEFDMVWSRSTYSTKNEEATVYANFTGADTYNIAGAKAIAILASASDANKSKFFWNGNEYTGFWSDYQSGPQIGFSPYDVTTALTSGLNVAKLQSFDVAGNGDNMYAMNTILVIESGSSQPTLNIPSNVTFNTMLTVPVQVEHLINATGVSFDITYDPSVIQLNSVTVNQSAIGTNTLTTNLTPGRARIAVTGTDGITINNRAALFHLNITGVGVNKAETPMTVLNAHWSETSFDVHPFTTINGSIIIGVRGDFNGNGFVDIGDTARVAYMVAKLTPVDMAADFNFVGTVDIGDASKIACYLVGKVAVL